MTNLRTNKIALRYIGVPLLALSFIRTAEAIPGVTCTVSGGPVAFGIYNPLTASPLDSSATVSVNCKLDTPHTVDVAYTLKFSAGSSNSYVVRTMKSPGNVALNYNLYTDSAHSQIWGDGSAGTSFVSGSMTLGNGLGRKGNQTDTYTNFGRMSAGQDVPPANYTDTVTITVEW